MNTMPKYVYSTTLESADWQNTTILSGDFATDDRQGEGRGRRRHPRRRHRARLVQGLIAADLLDELRLMVFPVILGGGKRLFADDGRKVPLTLTDARTVGAGIQLADLRADRGLAPGLFEGVLVLRLFAVAVDRFEGVLLVAGRGRGAGGAGLAAEGVLLDVLQQFFGFFAEFFRRQRRRLLRSGSLRCIWSSSSGFVRGRPASWRCPGSASPRRRRCTGGCRSSAASRCFRSSAQPGGL